jgi:hypothetical protein
VSEALQTLNCPKCGAKLPKTDADSVTCEYCGTVTVLRHGAETPASKVEPTAEAAATIAAYVKQIEQERAAQPRVLQPRIEVVYQNRQRYSAKAWPLFLLLRLLGIAIPLLVLLFVFGPQNSFRFVQTAFQFIQSRVTVMPGVLPPFALATLIPVLESTPMPDATTQGKEGGQAGVVATTAMNTPRAVVPLATATLPANNCPNEHARIVNPRNGATLRGAVAFTGAADIGNFSYYKLEARPENGNDWKAVFQRTIPVNGELMLWDTATTAPGRYQVRLVVVDKTGNFPGPCLIGVTVAR